MDRLTAAEAADVLSLAAAAEEADGVHPLSEDVVIRVRGGGGPHLLSFTGDDEPGHAAGGDSAVGLAGYAFLGEPGESGELVVHPDHRRRGHGTALLGAAGSGPLRVWAHGDLSSARVFADKNGFIRVRVLWQMRRTLAGLPDVPMPEGVTLRAFRPGHDEQAWLAVNGRAFADHPEQGRWTIDDLLVREGEPWFDPAGFLLAVDDQDNLVGFHWTKVHPPSGPDPALGEIYVLGVDPGGHRRGLGAALSVAGLRHLAAAGLTQSNLYVDESNSAAVALYRKLGFEIHKADVSYERPAHD